MEWNNIKINIGNWFAKLFLVIGILATIGGFIYTLIKPKEEISTPVERCEIDSLIVENDKLIIEIEHLDSIKNAKVIEVKSLDNDSTLKLFYQLIRK